MAMQATRRALLGAMATLPMAAPAVAASFNRDTLSGLEREDHEALFAELDAIDAATDHLNGTSAPQEEWDAWEEWTDRIYGHIESLPATPENAKLKSRAIWSIVSGKATDINEGQSTVCRLVQHLVAGMNREGC